MIIMTIAIALRNAKFKPRDRINLNFEKKRRDIRLLGLQKLVMVLLIILLACKKREYNPSPACRRGVGERG